MQSSYTLKHAPSHSDPSGAWTALVYPGPPITHAHWRRLLAPAFCFLLLEALCPDLCRKALRAAADNFEAAQPVLQSEHNLSDPLSLHKDCDFSLDLKVVTPADVSPANVAVSRDRMTSRL